MQRSDGDGDWVAVQSIEGELTLLVRRAQRVHLRGSSPEQVVERSAYGILAWLHDAGPMGPSALAEHFHLNPSTVSRQVASLEQAGLVARDRDDKDRRALRLRLTEQGQTVLRTTRAERRGAVRDLLQSWSREDLETFASLLAAFNTGLDDQVSPRQHTSVRSQE